MTLVHGGHYRSGGRESVERVRVKKEKGKSLCPCNVYNRLRGMRNMSSGEAYPSMLRVVIRGEDSL